MTLGERLAARAYDRLFPRWRPRAAHRATAPLAAGGVRITWLGTAGHVVSTGDTTILLDPYVSRPGFGRLARRRLEPDEHAISQWIPPHVDAVLCGHSHFDHLLDAPRIALLRGARLAGSPSTCNVARASGVADGDLVVVPPSGLRFTVGDIDVRFVPSLHGRIALGRVPFPGEIERHPGLPARAWHYRMGGAFGILLTTKSGVRIYHNGSADLVDAELDGEHADVLLVGLAGRQATRDYLARLTDALSPDLIVPTHHDAFFAPLEEGLRLLPGIDLDGFVAEAERLCPRASKLLPGYGEVIQVHPREARGATLVRS